MGDSTRFKREYLAVAAVLFLGSLFIVFPFLDAIIFGIAASYILRLAHNYLDRHIGNDVISSAIIITSVLGILGIGFYAFITNFGQILEGITTFRGSLETLAISVSDLLQLSDSFETQLVDFIGNLSGFAREEAVSIFAGIPSLIVHLGIFFVTAIYLYKDGVKIERTLLEIVENLPDTEKRIANSIVESMNYIFRGVFVTQFLVALTMGVIAGVGFLIISMITSPMPLLLLWSFLITITALLPLVANFMVYAPVGTYYLISGATLKGTLILAFGFTVLQILPEILIRPVIGSRQMDEHPLIIFTGFLAGPLTMGLKGLILGPVILILTKEFIMDSSKMFSS